MKILNLIMRIFGYKNIDKIIIPEYYKKPRKEKLQHKKEFYKRYGILPEIILDQNNILIDGFCSYYIARVKNIKYVKVRRVRI